jgi:hypothetical protein
MGKSGTREPKESAMRHFVPLFAVLVAFALAAPAAMAAGASSSSSNGKFCLKGPGKTMSCKYETMAACDKDKKTGQQCVTNSSTTGSAAGSSSNSMKK